MGKKGLERQPDGTVAFWTEKGERWRHRDLEEGRTGPGARIFISDKGEERVYRFGPNELHDATVEDLRDQLRRAEAASAGVNK